MSGLETNRFIDRETISDGRFSALCQMILPSAPQGDEMMIDGWLAPSPVIANIPLPSSLRPLFLPSSSSSHDAFLANGCPTLVNLVNACKSVYPLESRHVVRQLASILYLSGGPLRSMY